MNTDTFAGKTILVTGGTGTFGRAFVARLLAVPGIKKIIVFSRDEFKQHEMRVSLEDPERRVRFFLGDVRDLPRLERAFQGVDVVVHAAALKQVPALEYNPLEAVKTNINGTQNVIDAALDNNVDKVLFISSDKAVHPINLYGATKLCAEKLCVAANAYRGTQNTTRFSVIRYGNVWGSRGSLIELIDRQRPNGMITLTDERMTRFWISVDKIMGIMLNVLNNMQGGEIFVPKMASLRVIDVVKGLAPECEIKTIGIRPGEKLHEVLLTEHEARRTKDADDVYVVRPEYGDEFGWAEHDWLASKPSFPADSVYASNESSFLLGADDISKITAL